MQIERGVLKNAILERFVYDATADQIEAIDQLDAFISYTAEKTAFLLKGFAGTGKTSLIGALVKTLPSLPLQTVLLAPTGRAAKVLSNYSGKPAFTIHKQIYRLQSSADGFMMFLLQQNKYTDTLFIVDEASMISNSQGLENMNWGKEQNLLDDLISYVYSGKNCKLVLIGDTAQLPPVGAAYSPALDADLLRSSYYFTLFTTEMKEVVRQPDASDILLNATAIRESLLSEKKQAFRFKQTKKNEVVRVEGHELEELLNDAYQKYGAEEVMVVCRSNQRANLFNAQIRVRIKWLDEEIAAGDYIMVVKNNYFWLADDSKAGFIANGDILEILKVKRIEEQYHFRFADCTVRLIDYPNEPDLEVKILLNTIMNKTPALSKEQSGALYSVILEDYADIPEKKKKRGEIRKNPYYNALQVKFAYAITCHKSQGGQWKVVFVDQGYLAEDRVDKEYYRWLYTALTRASEKVYLVGFNDSFF
ncbi:ATP-dependent RecD-like DNA helicase [Flavobacteriales bacterium]|nr:ATP-dependent RecD-like DNA helicase [Flavobacteriales bacterium]MCL4815959.1 AAA family ATPase [Flavobacteriales bacterium]WKZ74290.1 MAG: AAA family ATPase [Vicingaceae bacterium]GIK70648.1 MAG: ATP-dependent exodeoxyribonuclease [Bacteroidota bacterium]CAG0978186.1 ATP-dependent RecD-like DNA helicase [Flavobacteriales bacterium]